jgi:hypothetical protein
VAVKDKGFDVVLGPELLSDSLGPDADQDTYLEMLLFNATLVKNVFSFASLDLFLKYITLQDPNVRYVALATLLLGGVSGAVGSFNFLRKKTLVGETVAHSMLPGVLIAFLLSGVKESLCVDH